MAFNLFYSAILVKYKKNVIIPHNWCKTLNIAETMNEGLNRNTNHVIFYSVDMDKQGNFELPIDKILDLNEDGCYWAKIVRCFGEYQSHNSFYVMFEI